MSTETQELVRICEQLPKAQRAQVANYARSLLSETRVKRAEHAQSAVATRPHAASRFGFASGLFEIRDDFDAPLDEFAEYR
jgi:hypothetical protein